MAQVYNPQWGRMMEIEQELFDRMAEENFQPSHNGGGLFAWLRYTDDDGGRLLITVEADHGEWQDRNKPVWSVGRYDRDDNWVMVIDVTLEQAFEIADEMRAPEKGEERVLELARPEQLLADEFVRLLGKALTPAQFEEMKKRNRAEQGEGICHSHDFIDANMVMAEACEELGIPLFNENGEIEDKATELWNKAWQLAMPHLR